MGALSWVGGGLALLLAGGSLVVAALMLRQVRQLQGQKLDLAADLAAALSEMEQLAAMTAKLGVHTERIDRSCTELAERMEIMELRHVNRSFDEAIDSARRGADPARLERQFGLSRTEAGLVMLLHGSAHRGRTPATDAPDRTAGS